MKHPLLLTGVLYVAACAILLIPDNQSVAGTLYKWVDENGHVSYQDRPPIDVNDFESADMSERDVGRLLQQDPEEKRQEVLESKPVTIYIADNCDACDTLRVFLQKMEVPFEEKDLSKDEPAQRELIAIGGKLQVPATTIGDKLVWGYNREGLQRELNAAGYEQPERELTEQQPETAPNDQQQAEDDAAITQN